MALDKTEEFFIGDYVYYVSNDGSYTKNGKVIDKVFSKDKYWYGIDCDGYTFTADANHLSYTI